MRLVAPIMLRIVCYLRHYSRLLQNRSEVTNYSSDIVRYYPQRLHTLCIAGVTSLHLCAVQSVVDAFPPGEQWRVRALFHHRAPKQYDDAIGVTYARQAMADDHCRPSLAGSRQWRLHQLQRRHW